MIKAGWIAQFLSRAVVTGFLFGAAIDVVIGELPKITGTEASGSNSLRELWSWLGSVDETHGRRSSWVSSALVVIFGLRVVAPQVPGALVLVVGGLGASWLLDLGDRGVALVGDVPRGLPSFAVPDGRLMWEHAGTGALAALALVLIGFSQTAGDARTFAARHRYRSTSTRSPSRRGWRTPEPGCSRACRSRPACRRARSTTMPAPGRAWPPSPPGSGYC